MARIGYLVEVVTKQTGDYMKSLLSITLLMIFFFSCGYEESEISQATLAGDKIIAAIEKYYAKSKKYPNSLQLLIPEYLDSIPTTGLEGNKQFYYILIPKDKGNQEEYGFRLSFYVDKIYFMGARKRKQVVYFPSQKYTTSRYKTIHRTIGKWAYRTVYRQYD
jgi:hypothetical protein